MVLQAAATTQVERRRYTRFVHGVGGNAGAIMNPALMCSCSDYISKAIQKPVLQLMTWKRSQGSAPVTTSHGT